MAEERSGFRIDDALASPKGRRLRDLPGLVRQALVLVIAAARREFAITAVLQLVASGGLAVQLLVGRDLLAKILDAKQRGFSPVIPDVIILAVVIGIIAVANSARGELQSVLAELVARFAVSGVIDVSARVGLLAFETPAFHDRQQRALVNASVRPLQMTTGLLGLVGSLMASASVGAALLTIQPILALAVFLAVIPLYFASVTASRAMYHYAVAQTELDRRRFYLQSLLTTKDTAKEIRAYDTGSFLKARYDDIYDQHLGALRKMVRQRTMQGVIGSAATAVLTGGTLGLLIAFVSWGRLSLAGAGAAAGAILLLGSQLQGVASGIGQLYESSLFIKDFTNFAGSLPAVEARRGQLEVPPPFEALRTEHLSFQYPSRTTPSLHDVSIELRRGEVVALVGENGSGKTTLAKLIAGLYEPTSGHVAWDGQDIATFDPAQLSRRVAVLFQDFVRYHLTARENVAMGNRERFDDAGAVAEAARVAGAEDFLVGLDGGYETLLGPEYYGGVDLSVGQWQRVALARAFFRNAELIVLDEPTASLDPRAEAELFTQVRTVFAGRTILLISHRFASVRLADRIYVLDGGRIIESGSHQELMDLGGSYAGLFTMQAAAFGISRPPRRPRLVRKVPGAAKSPPLT